MPAILQFLSFFLAFLALFACRSDHGTRPDTGETTGACTWYLDADGNGYGDPDAGDESSCDAPPSGYVGEAGDCDDTDAAVHPAAEETCDGVDEDCDGEVDEDAVDAATWYADTDEDGYGDLSDSTTV